MALWTVVMRRLLYVGLAKLRCSWRLAVRARNGGRPRQLLVIAAKNRPTVALM
jgi:hypothetical protein